MNPEKLLEQHEISSTPPIPVRLLLRKIGIIPVPYDFNNLKDIMPVNGLDGIIFHKNEIPYFFFNKTKPYEEQRYALAYTLGYYYIHSTESRKTRLVRINRDDWAVCEFASELLIPAKSLHDICPRFLIAPPLSGLAYVYGVPISDMQKKLDKLNINYIKNT